MARQSTKFSGKVTLLFDSMLVQNQAPESEGGGDSVERAIIIAASLDVAQDSDNIIRTKTTAIPNVSIPYGMDTGGSPRSQDTMRGAPAQTRSERVLEKPNKPPLSEGHTSGSGEGSMEHTFELTDNVPNIPHDSPLSGCYTPGSDEGRMKLIQDIMVTCTSLTKKVLALEEAKTAQDRVITRLKLRVKRLEKKRKARTPQPMKRRLFKGRVESSNDHLDKEDTSKQGRTNDKTKLMFQDSEFDKLDDDMDNVKGKTVNTATTRVSVVSAPVTTAGVAISTAKPRPPPTTAATAFIDEDLTIAQTLVKMRSKKAKVKGISFSDVEETPILNRSTTTLQPLPTIDPKDKGKGVLVEEEPEKPDKVKRRDQIHLNRSLTP
ncbi:hypothetical protein Tco_0824268 [Tanacetum coccineum]|uniref:Uncharacterized protein n=1 Tax=Tanacetum coccineum TaxID=301880 RepID=A0ABQ5AQ97_9ASTR